MSKSTTFVQQVLAFLKITEEGKVENFFAKEKSRLSKEIKTLQRQKEILQSNEASDVEAIDDKIADARQELQEARLSVDLEQLKNNESMNKFSQIYWSRIDNFRTNIERLEEQKEDLITRYKDQMQEIDEQITAYTERIDSIF